MSASDVDEDAAPESAATDRLRDEINEASAAYDALDFETTDRDAACAELRLKVDEANRRFGRTMQESNLWLLSGPH